jgi:hypothetical protein
MSGYATITTARIISIIATFRSVTCNANEKYFKNIPLIILVNPIKNRAAARKFILSIRENEEKKIAIIDTIIIKVPRIISVARNQFWALASLIYITIQ